MRFFALVVLLAFVWPNFSQASSIVRTGETVYVSAEQSVDGDFYGLGNTVSVSGEVKEDILLAAGKVDLNGEVGADVMVVAGTVDLYGNVADDVRIIAGVVTVAGEIKGNLVVVASELNILSTAKIDGDLMFFGGSLEVSGPVGKDVYGTSEKIRIDSDVSGNVDIKTGSLVLGNKANIAGDVIYTSGIELVRAQDAKIGGKISKNTIPAVEKNIPRTLLIPFLISLFAALVWHLLFRRFINKIVDSVHASPLHKSLVGFGTLFLLPISAAIMFFSTIGSILGVTLISIYLFIIFVSFTLSGIVVGSLIYKLLGKNSTVSIPYIVLGVLVTHALVYLPVVGPLALLALFVVTLGSITDRIYSLFRNN